MDDSKFGTEDANGNWAPKEPISYGPAFAWPPQPRALLKWFFGFPGYFLPWNLLYAVAALGIWFYLTPPLEKIETLSASWAGIILLRNFRVGCLRLWCVAFVAVCLA